MARTYRSVDGVAAQDGPFGCGWHWTYDVRAVTHCDGSVTIVEADGRRAVFWKNGATWTPAAFINATLTTAQGGGYVLTRHDQTVWTFDADGKLIAIADRAGNTQALAYTAGRLSSVTAPNGRALTITTDPAGYIIQISGPGGAGSRTVSYGYDANGNLTSVTDANNHTRTASYDALDRVATVTDALGNTWTYAYDAVGNLTHVQLPTLVTTRRDYDSRNRLTGIDLTDDGILDIQYAYDAASRRTSMTDATGVTMYTYDNADRLTSVTAPGTGSVGYAYNAAGERTGLTYPSGHQVTCAYTLRGELDTVTDWLTGVADYTYDNAGRLAGIAYPNGVTTSLSYDNADRLTGILHARSGTTLEAIGYVVDAVGKRTGMTDGTGTTSWAYDALDRLAGANDPDGDVVTYAYDAVGNRTSRTVNGATTTYTYDAADRLLTAGTDTFGYDAAGRQTSAAVGGVTTTYGYDPLDRLTSISGAVSASYSYNGDGLRVGKTVTGVTTAYAWDPTGLGTVLAVGSDEYVWGEGLIGRITAAGVKTFAHADGLGSVGLLTDAAGAVVGTQQYDAFGATRAQTGAQLPFTYTGEQVDAESGLVYLRARSYDPATGRFLTRDPFPGRLADPRTLHPYAYVGNNPLNGTDPSGRNPLPWDPVAGGGGEVVGEALALANGEGLSVASSPHSAAIHGRSRSPSWSAAAPGGGPSSGRPAATTVSTDRPRSLEISGGSATHRPRRGGSSRTKEGDMTPLGDVVGRVRAFGPSPRMVRHRGETGEGSPLRCLLALPASEDEIGAVADTALPADLREFWSLTGGARLAVV